MTNAATEAALSAIKTRRNENAFVASIPFTPKNLLNEMVDKVDVNTDASVLVMFTVEFVPVLLERGYTDITVTTDKYCQKTKQICDVFGVTYTLMDDIDMKFDVCIMNPPFSKAGDKKGNVGKTSQLYPIFYKWAVDNCKSVAAVMPSTRNQQTKHNETLKSTAYAIDDIDDGTFDIMIKTCVVYHDKDEEANVSCFFADFTKNNNISFNKGKGGNAVVGGATPFVRAVLQSGADITTTSINKPKAIVQSPFCVCISLRLNDKGFNTDIIKSKGKMIGSNVYFVECQTMEEALEVQSVIDSEDFYGQLLDKRGNSNTVTLSALKSVIA